MKIIGLRKSEARRLLQFARPHQVAITLALIVGIVSSLAALAQPLVVGRVLDAVRGDRSVGAAVTLLVCLFATDAILKAVQSYLLGRSAEAIVLNVRWTLVGRLLRLPVATHDRHRTGDLLSRVGTDSTLLGTALTDNFARLATSVITLVGAVILMAVIDLLLFLIALACVLAATLSILALSSRIRVADEQAQIKIGDLGAALERALSAIRTVKISQAEERESQQISGEARAAYDAGVRSVKLEAAVQPATIIAVQGSFVLVLGIGGVRLASGVLSLGDLVSFLLYLLYLVSPLIAAFTSITSLQRGLAALGRVEEILTLQSEREAAERPTPDENPIEQSTIAVLRQDERPVVEFESVTFGYDPEYPVLEQVSFSVPEFTRTALVGPSGAGKSSAFSLIEGFYEPDSGSIRLGGVDLQEMKLSELRRQVGCVEQDAPVMAGTIRQNLLYASPEATEEEIARIAKLANLYPLLDRLPRGLETEVGDRGVLLSGGERQRVAIARTLLARPRLLLLDEVTSQVVACDYPVPPLQYTGVRSTSETVQIDPVSIAAIAGVRCS